MKVSEAISRLQTLDTNQNIAIVWWSKDEVIDFSCDFTDETLDISDDEWVKATDQFVEDSGIINEQMWQQLTDIIENNRKEQQ